MPSCGMAVKIFHFMVIWLQFVSWVQASSERLIDLDSVSVKSAKHELVINAGRDNEGNLGRLEVVFSGKRIIVPASELIGCTKVMISSMAITSSSSVVEVPKPVSNLMISFEFGDLVYHSDKGKEILVSSAVRFVFRNGVYLYREKYVPQDGIENLWISFEKHPGEKEFQVGETKQAGLPFKTE
jgi:hypothetical protein